MRWGEAVLRGYRDQAIRHGIKCGLAGILAIFIAEWMRLPSPGSALLTVFMLMFAQYVGAIADKSFMRLAGTLVGGVLGYLFCGSLQQDPVWFVGLVSLVVGFCSAMYGQARYPYGFFLIALTILVICGDGMADPAASWSVMLYRVQEITVGVISSLLVQNLIWPRYARLEFLDATRAAFQDLAVTFGRAAPAMFEKGAPDIVKANEGFLARTAGLRSLLEHGMRESRFFRNRLHIYSSIVTDLNRIAAATLGIDDPLTPDSPFREFYRASILDVHQAITSALMELGNPAATSATRGARLTELTEAFARLEIRMEESASTNFTVTRKTEDLLTIGQHILSLEEIFNAISQVCDYVDRLQQERGLDSREIRHESRISTVPSPFWIRTGVRSAVVTAIALIIVNWVKVPGAGDLLVYSWVFVSINNASPTGLGDARAIHQALLNCAVILVLCLLVFLITPALAAYDVMNLVIFGWLFLCGFLSASMPGLTISYLTASFFLVGLVGLNAQEPVRFVQVEALFFGIALPLVLAALVQRLVLPSLPQWEFRDRMREFLGLCRDLIKQKGSPLPAWKAARLSLIPGELQLRLKRLPTTIFAPHEVRCLEEYVSIFRVTAFRISVVTGRLPNLVPDEFVNHARTLVSRLDGEIDLHLAKHSEALVKERVPDLDLEKLDGLLRELSDWVLEVRTSMIQAGIPLRKVVRVTGIAGRYNDLAESLRAGKHLAGQLDLRSDMGDHWL